MYRFSQVFVTKIEWTGSSGDEQLQESVEFVYGGLQVTYTSSQSGAKPAVAAWSQVTNTSDYTVPAS